MPRLILLNGPPGIGKSTLARQVRAIVADEGGDEVLVDYHRRLTELPARRPLTRVVASIAGDEDRTYRDLVTAIG